MDIYIVRWVSSYDDESAEHGVFLECYRTADEAVKAMKDSVQGEIDNLKSCGMEYHIYETKNKDGMDYYVQLSGNGIHEWFVSKLFLRETN